jgi:predicted TIM-barrel fold metal-dependent hydrolase
MIIDMHYHLVVEDWLPEAWWNLVTQIYVGALKAMGMDSTPEDVRKNILDTFWDPNGENLIKEMDESGIDKSVILPQDFGLAIGESKVSVEDQNKAYAELQNKYPDRIIAFATIDPRRPHAIDFIEKAINEWGLKGVKLHPGSGYYPDAEELTAFFAKLSELGVPVLTHAGFWPLRSKHCDPIYFDDILVAFPNLTIIFAHFARGWQNLLFEMAGHRHNAATDFSGMQFEAQSHYGRFCQNMRAALDSFSPARVLFGTDGPFYRPLMSNKDYIQIVKDLPKNAPDGITFTEEEVTAVLGGAAAGILGISD